MKMNRTIVFLCLVAIAWAAPLSHNEHSATGENKDVSIASSISEHYVVKNNKESYELQISRKVNGNTSPISEGHSDAKSEESGIKKSYTSASPVDGAADFVEANENGDGKAETSLNNVKTPSSKTNKVADGKGAGRKSTNGNTEDEIFSYSPNGTGGGNVHYASKTEFSRLDQNDENSTDGENASSRNIAGDRHDDTASSRSNQVQNLTSKNVGVPESSEPEENTSLKAMGSKIYGENVQWTDMNEGASGHGGDTSEEGSTDGWGDGNSEETKDKTEIHDNGSKSQTLDGTGTTDSNRGGDGDRDDLDDSLSTSEEDSSEEHKSRSAENSETVELCHKAKKNEHSNFQKRRNRVLHWKGTGKANSSHKKEGITGNHGIADGILDGKRRKILRDERKVIGGLTKMNSSQDARKHRNKPRDSSDISKEDENNDSFSNELMQGDDPNASHAAEDSENSEKDEEESNSEDKSNDHSDSNDEDSGSQPHSKETESGSQSASSASKSDSSDARSDSSSESDSKSGSSQSNSDSSSESKSDSSGESNDSESSESKSQAVSSENDSRSGTDNDASDNESKSNESNSQSANHSDSGTASMSDESDTDGSDVAETTENTSDSDSAENKDSNGGSPSGTVDSESESISEGSESNDSTSDY